VKTDVITIDGPTSSGKNSVGFLLAQKLGYQFIDTGMIYRLGTYLALKNNCLDNVEAITKIFKNLKLQIKTTPLGVRIFHDNEDLTDVLHNPQVTKNVSAVSALKPVREITRVIQRQLGESKNTVMTGRDIGSEIFPTAKHKFYLTATREVRARRRFNQLVAKYPSVKYEQVLQEMIERDKKDSTRETSPLRIPEDAVVIDNSHKTIEQTVEEILKYIHASN